MRSRWVECSFFVPLRRDANLADGELHSTLAWTWLHDELDRIFGGLTEAPGIYRGAYIDPDTKAKVKDWSRRYIVALESKDVRKLRRLLAQACSVFEQKCIYLSVAGHVEFIQNRERS